MVLLGVGRISSPTHCVEVRNRTRQEEDKGLRVATSVETEPETKENEQRHKGCRHFGQDQESL